MNSSDEEFEKALTSAMEAEARTGEGFRAAEEYFAGPYKANWNRVWEEGRSSSAQGKNREDNPHTLKIWHEVWNYGFDSYDPDQALRVFAELEAQLAAMPLRPMTDSDI